MDPNNNQPLGTNPVAQPAPQATSVPTTQPASDSPSPVPTLADDPKGKSSKVVILLVILLLLVVGMVAYSMFAKNQMNNAKKAATENTSEVIASPTLAPTLTPEEDLQINSPEADLRELDADVKGL